MAYAERTDVPVDKTRADIEKTLARARTRVKTQVAGERHGQAKLSAEAVRAIRESAGKGESQLTIGKRFGVCQSVISGVLHRKGWRHV